ncbi:MAG: NAD(P)/FAD-dependent oxidoreductase, partial [Actinomycetota bacterium]|nr:NAD(P)/FAD-dependent oxidoreductase [Actinomycetota bacterium]
MAPQIEPAQSSTTDQRLAEMVAVADLPSLLAALAHITASPDLPGAGLLVDPAKHHEPQAGWTPDQQSRARSIAL